MRVLTLFTRNNCSLCDEAYRSLNRIVVQNKSVQLKIVDIDEPKYRDKWQVYTFDVPVVHLDDKVLMMHKVDEKALATALSK